MFKSGGKLENQVDFNENFYESEWGVWHNAPLKHHNFNACRWSLPFLAGLKYYKLVC